LKGLGKRLKAKVTPESDGLPTLDEICERAGFRGEEGEILREKVKAILDAEKEAREFLAGSKEQLGRSLADLKDEEALKARMAEFRKGRDARKATVAELKESLRGILSYDQEAKLVAMGVLE